MKDFAGIVNTSGTFPSVVAQNDTTPGSLDGTPLVKQWVDEIFGSYQALLNFASLTPSGTAELYNSSQILDALKAGFVNGIEGGTYSPSAGLTWNETIVADAASASGSNVNCIVGTGKGLWSGVVGLGEGSSYVYTRSRAGVYGRGGTSGGEGVIGVGTGSNPGVYGEAASDNGVEGSGGSGEAGVYGFIDSTAGSGNGVHGDILTGATGYGVYGEGRGAGNAGVYGEGHDSDTHGILGVGNDTLGYGVIGMGEGATQSYATSYSYADGAGVVGIGASAGGPGVYARGYHNDGLGLVAYGGMNRAPLRLIPRAAPTTREVGDVYINSSGTMFICSVGLIWQEVAFV